MNNDRSYILDRLKSRTISVAEFNFDTLQAPPLSMFLTPQDIQNLTDIAMSLRLSGKPDVKYKMIDQILKTRGLVKFLAGTNRVVYRHPEFPDILFKIASDAVGINDNPAEFKNQMLLKPFVPKIFEVSPHGTVALTERVVPITSREEFLSVADDVFELITGYLLNAGYVLADFGSKFFMNYGIRKGFGVVLLDYPYLYKLDGNKLFCNKPDHKSPTGKCEGVIDYDAGYNFLHCTKCGAVYKAKELETKIKANEIISESKGENKMRVRVSGGSREFKNEVKSFVQDNENLKETIPAVNVKNSDSFFNPADTFGNDSEWKATESGVRVRVRRGRDYPSSVNQKVEEVSVNSPIMYADKENKNKTTVEKKVEHKKDKKIDHTSFYEEKKLSVNGVSSNAKAVDSPFSISTDTGFKDKMTEYDAALNLKKSPVKAIEDCMKNISKYLDDIQIDISKKDITDRLVDFVLALMPDDPANLNVLLRAAKDMSENIIFDNTPEGTVQYYNAASAAGAINDSIVAHAADICIDNEKAKEYAHHNDTEENKETAVEEKDNSDDEQEIKSYARFSAKIVQLSEIAGNVNKNDSNDCKVIVLSDADNHYAGFEDGCIIVADSIDDQKVDNVRIISKSVYNSLMNMVDREPEPDRNPDRASEEAITSDTTEESKLSTEEFLNTEFKGDKVEV